MQSYDRSADQPLDLFMDDPAFIEQKPQQKKKMMRNSLGQFCTPEQARIERVEKENIRLKRDVEKYMRAWVAVCKSNVRLERENKQLKEKYGL